MGKKHRTGQLRTGSSTDKKPGRRRKTKRPVQPVADLSSDNESSDSIRFRRPHGVKSTSSRAKKPPDGKQTWAKGDSDAETVLGDELSDTERYADHDEGLYDEQDKRRGEYQIKREGRESRWRKIWTINGFIDPWLSRILGKIFGWRVFRRFMKETPWMIMLAQVVLMVWIGTTCLEPVDSMLGGVRYYATIGDYSLGGWGYCVSGTCTYEVGYSLDLTLTMDVPLFSNAIVLPYLCMTLVLGSGILLFFFFYLLMERWRDYRWTRNNQRDLERAEGKSGRMLKSCRPFLLAEAGFVATQFELRSQNSQRLERSSDLQRPWWRPWQIMMSLTMWIAFTWNLIVFIALEAWMKLTLATAEQGDDLKYWLMGVSTSWVVVSHVYRSYWVYGSVQKEEREQGEDESDWSSDDSPI